MNLLTSAALSPFKTLTTVSKFATMRLAWVAVTVALLAVFVAYIQRNFVSRVNPDVVHGSGAFFDDIAPRYDVLNRVISLGYDRSWRATAAAAALPAESVLDVSTGTGDVVRALLAHETPPRTVVGVDPSLEMLRLAREKFTAEDVQFVPGTAEALPFESGKFDAAIVSFGVRNFADRTAGLAEMTRVVRPGGRLVVLEVSHTHSRKLMARAKNLFVSSVMPLAASLFSGHPFAYRYLSSSMRTFPTVPQFSSMLREAGCENVRHSRLPPFGVGPDLYVCDKPATRASNVAGG